MHSDGPQKYFFTVLYLWNQNRYLCEIFRNYSGGYNRSLEQIKHTFKISFWGKLLEFHKWEPTITFWKTVAPMSKHTRSLIANWKKLYLVLLLLDQVYFLSLLPLPLETLKLGKETKWDLISADSVCRSETPWQGLNPVFETYSLTQSKSHFRNLTTQD